MRKIIEILRVEHRTNIKGAPYKRTYALVDSGEECVGYGDDFKTGDLVEVFFHREIIKMRKRKK